MKNNSILVVTKKNTDDIKNMAIALNKNLIIYDELEDNEFIYNPLHNNDINFVVEKILSAMELESFQLTPFFKELHYNVLHNAITLLKKYNENFVDRYTNSTIFVSAMDNNDNVEIVYYLDGKKHTTSSNTLSLSQDGNYQIYAKDILP